MHHMGTFAPKVRYFLCFLGETLGNVYLKGGITGCPQVWPCSAAPGVGGSCVFYRPRSDFPSSGWLEVELGFSCPSWFSCLIHPLSSYCL